METEIVSDTEYWELEALLQSAQSSQPSASASRPSSAPQAASVRNTANISLVPSLSRSAPKPSPAAPAVSAKGPLNNNIAASTTPYTSVNHINNATRSLPPQQQNGGAPVASRPNPSNPTQVSSSSRPSNTSISSGRPPPPRPKDPNAPTIEVKFEVFPTSTSRFAAVFSYNPALIEACKAIPDRNYDTTQKSWTFPISRQDEVAQALNAVPSVNASIAKIPPFVTKALALISAAPAVASSDPLEDASVPGALVDRLMAFQKDGVRFGISKDGRVLIGDEMGLGKTVQAIGVALYYRKEWPLLVITPAALKYTWKEAFENWVPWLQPSSLIVVEGAKFFKKRDTKADVYIASYDQVSKNASEVEQFNFKVIIADESHSIKNFKAKRTTTVSPLLQKSKRAILLTGTPAVSRPVELYTQLQALHPEIFTDFFAFGGRYCDPKKSRYTGGLEYNGACRLKELNTILGCLMIRRLKAAVLTQLPEKQRQKIWVDIDDTVAKQIRAVMDSLPPQQKEPDDGEVYVRNPAITKIYKMTGEAKMLKSAEYVQALLEGSEGKLLVFAHHDTVLTTLAGMLEHEKIGYIRIDGSVSSQQRQALVNEFQTSASCRVAVLSITAAGVGLTLTDASTVIFAELAWTPGAIQQAEDRAHRIGQKSSVNVHYLLAKGTADDMMWRMLEKKVNVVTSALSGINCASMNATDSANTSALASASGSGSGSGNHQSSSTSNRKEGDDIRKYMDTGGGASKKLLPVKRPAEDSLDCIDLS